MYGNIDIKVSKEWVDALVKDIETYSVFEDTRQKIWRHIHEAAGLTADEEKKEPVMKKKEPKKIVKKVEKKPVSKKKPSKKSDTKKETTTQCVKVASLRKETGDKEMTMEKWIEDPNNVYVGRPGRIFIGTGDEKRIFHYKGSKFANPYKVGTKDGEYTLEESLKLYQTYLKDKKLLKDIGELKGKNLGCFCDQKGKCHAKILAELANK